jgi:hypothetical protein
VNRPRRRGQASEEVKPDAATLLSRALRMAQRRMHYRIAAALIVAATIVGTLLLVR